MDQLEELASRLKACPFCATHDLGITQLKGGCYRLWVNHDVTCYLHSHVEAAYIEDIYGEPEELVRQWNNRPEPSKSKCSIEDEQLVHRRAEKWGMAICDQVFYKSGQLSLNWADVTCRACLEKREQQGPPKSRKRHMSITMGGSSRPLCQTQAKNPDMTDSPQEVTCGDCQKLAQLWSPALAPPAIYHGWRGPNPQASLCGQKAREGLITNGWSRVNCPDRFSRAVVHKVRALPDPYTEVRVSAACTVPIPAEQALARSATDWEKVTCKNCLRRRDV